MKKFFAIFLGIILLLSGCSNFSLGVPETLESGEKIYETGFYGSLYPNNLNPEDCTLDIGNITLTKIENDKFDLYHADIGTYTEGTIYCEQSDYENAVKYYNNPNNYSYYCILSVASDKIVSKNIEIPDIDTVKFNALLKFADESRYDPFNMIHNNKINKVDLPMPDENKDIRINLYKESSDSLFISTTGDDYYIINNSLYLAYQYDYGKGLYEKLIAVKVPDEIGNYFVEYLKPLTTEYLSTNQA